MNEGDKVRVVGNSNPSHNIPIGEVCTVVKTVGYFRGYGDIKIKYEDLVQSVCLADVEIVTSHGTLQVGETYTSINGNKWECVAVKGDIAWLAAYHYGDALGTAYIFKADGTPICLAIGGDKYRIKFEPVAEVKYQYTTIEGHPVTIKYTTKDGVLDEDSITAEVAAF